MYTSHQFFGIKRSPLSVASNLYGLVFHFTIAFLSITRPPATTGQYTAICYTPHFPPKKQQNAMSAFLYQMGEVEQVGVYANAGGIRRDLALCASGTRVSQGQGLIGPDLKIAPPSLSHSRIRVDSPKRMGMRVAKMGLVRRGPEETPAASKSRIISAPEGGVSRSAFDAGLTYG